MNNINIIFLDVDGVLNSQKHAMEIYKITNKPSSGFNFPFDEKCLENLKMIIQETNAKVVITSTWRKHANGKTILLSNLKRYNLDKDIIGYTPILNKERGLEIAAFLDKLDFNPNFIILDDDDDMGHLSNYLIKTNIEIGLTYENAVEAIEKLNNHNKKLLKKK